MELNELIKNLSEDGQEIVNRVFPLHNEALYNLNKLYGGRFIEIVNTSNLGQPSSAFGDPRIIQIEKVLNELEFDAKAYHGESDLLLNKYDVEIKGSFRRHNVTYGKCQSGNYSKKHKGRLHIFLKAKINVDEIKVSSLQLEIYYAGSNAFESKSGKSGKTNRSVFNEKKAELIGIWETGNYSEKDNQTRLF